MKEEPFNAFLKRCQLWKACENPNGSYRPVMEYIFFENGYAYASDSHILVKVPLIHITTLDEESRNLLNGHGIHSPLFKLLTTMGPLRVEKETITNDKGEETEKVHIYAMSGDNEVKVTLTNPEQKKHPNYEPLFQKNGERVPIHKIGVSQKRLSDLTAAMGTSDIKMGFIKEDQKIFISPMSLELEGIEGIIMPLMITGTFEGFE